MPGRAAVTAPQAHSWRDGGDAGRRCGCRRRRAPGRGRSGRCGRGLAIPHSNGAADRASRGIVVRVTLRLQRRAPPHPLAPRCLPGLRPDGVVGSDDGATCGEPGCVLLPLARPAPPPGGPKGPSDDGGREELVEFCARRSACSIASACSRQVSSTSAAGSSALKEGAVHASEVDRGFLLIASTVNQIGAPAATPITLSRVTSPQFGQGEVNGYRRSPPRSASQGIPCRNRPCDRVLSSSPSPRYSIVAPSTDGPRWRMSHRLSKTTTAEAEPANRSFRSGDTGLRRRQRPVFRLHRQADEQSSRRRSSRLFSPSASAL